MPTNLLRIGKYLIVIAVFSVVATYVGRQATMDWVAPAPSRPGTTQSRPDASPSPTSTGRLQPDQADGDPVRAMQLKLVACGVLPKDQVDGRLGPATISAIQTLQYSAGLEADGVFGPLTRQQAQRCKAVPTAG